MVDYTLVGPISADPSALHTLGPPLIPQGSNQVHVALLCTAQSMELTRMAQWECC